MCCNLAKAQERVLNYRYIINTANDIAKNKLDSAFTLYTKAFEYNKKSSGCGFNRVR